ncbi:MAG: aspartate--ammonia ligase [Peptoniphilaceae bacterium]|nr:aspartate--ammonia ligase [Peptoniphilaceae bacterium]MDD7383420.1 aspartate--ammonia ligase [Peptoniphilaceae bacterium]MDY3738815.1 aspartate--ammonia ligase [Peptoniphilaceae bacterium]
MEKLFIPEGYVSEKDIYKTQKVIKRIKDFFEISLSHNLNLKRVSAPLFVTKNSGLNDDLNGIERPVDFTVNENNSPQLQIVHSLAKWKRYALKEYGFNTYEGLYTDMNAIRRDEEVDNIHSYYVDQRDWEKVIKPEDRNINFLKETVKTIYSTLKALDEYTSTQIAEKPILLPENIKFITTQELEDRFPSLSPKEREDKAAEEYKAFFLMQIGKNLNSGKKHDGRAPDYDDWSLNGDIIVYNPILNSSFELSSMGIRVDADTLKKQLQIENKSERLNLPFHKALIEGNLPQTIGGGIGQSRLCMFFMQKAHIGEVQVSYWSDEIRNKLKESGIFLL